MYRAEKLLAIVAAVARIKLVPFESITRHGLGAKVLRQTFSLEVCTRRRNDENVFIRNVGRCCGRVSAGPCGLGSIADMGYADHE